MRPPVQSVAPDLRRARSEMDIRVETRLEAGAGSLRVAEQRLRGRLEESGARVPPGSRPPSPAGSSAGSADLRPPPEPDVAGQAGGRGSPEAPARAPSLPSPPPPAPARAAMETVLALVERVELFTRQGRLALGFSIGGPLGQRVHLERLGPGRVAVRLRGGAFGPAQARQLAAGLGERGVRLCRLEWDCGPRS